MTAMQLGGGRATKESDIDLRVGVVLHKKVGDHVAAGESLAAIHAASYADVGPASARLFAAYTVAEEKPEKPPFIKAIIK